MRWLLPLLLASCGDNVTGDPFALQNGWRLELRYWVYEDGTRQWDPSAIFDTQFGTDCTVERWSDGHTYCTPAAALVAYADAACSAPVGHVENGLEPPGAFRREFVIDHERRTSRLYRRTGERAPLEQHWWFRNNICEGPFHGGGDLYFDVEEIEPARVRETEPLGDARVRLAMHTSHDGMRAPARYFDTAVDHECVPTITGDDATICVPSRSASVGYFRDDRCTVQLLAFAGEKPLPPAARIEDASGCPSYVRIGAEVSKYPLYYEFGESCLPIDLPDDELVYELVEPIVAPLERRIDAGGERLHPIELAEGSMHVPDPYLHDALLGTACAPVQIGEVTRCLPRLTTARVDTYFTTEVCTGPITLAVVPGRSCDPPVRHAAEVIGGDLRIRELGDRYTGPLYAGSAFSPCKPVVLGTDFEARLASGALPLEQFVEGRPGR